MLRCSTDTLSKMRKMFSQLTDMTLDLDSRDALPSAVEQFSNPSVPIGFDLCHVMTVNHISPTLWAPITTAEFYSALRAIWIPRSGPGTRTPKVGMFRAFGPCVELPPLETRVDHNDFA